MRRLRSDLIEVYKIMHNLECLKREDYFPLRSAGRRGHRYTITKQYSRLNSRTYFFSQMMVDQWNRLPNTNVCAETVNRLKQQIYPMLWQHGGSLYANVGFLIPSYRPAGTPKANGQRELVCKLSKLVG